MCFGSRIATIPVRPQHGGGWDVSIHAVAQSAGSIRIRVASLSWLLEQAPKQQG
jgi:hypothetical protein